MFCYTLRHSIAGKMKFWSDIRWRHISYERFALVMNIFMTNNPHIRIDINNRVKRILGVDNHIAGTCTRSHSFYNISILSKILNYFTLANSAIVFTCNNCVGIGCFSCNFCSCMHSCCCDKKQGNGCEKRFGNHLNHVWFLRFFCLIIYADKEKDKFRAVKAHSILK